MHTLYPSCLSGQVLNRKGHKGKSLRALRNILISEGWAGKNKKVPDFSGTSIKVGDDLLSHNCSTIGAGGLNFSVRNGKRWNPVAIVTLRLSIPYDTSVKKANKFLLRKFTGN